MCLQIDNETNLRNITQFFPMISSLNHPMFHMTNRKSIWTAEQKGEERNVHQKIVFDKHFDRYQNVRVRSCALIPWSKWRSLALSLSTLVSNLNEHAAPFLSTPKIAVGRKFIVCVRWDGSFRLSPKTPKKNSNASSLYAYVTTAPYNNIHQSTTVEMTNVAQMKNRKFNHSVRWCFIHFIRRDTTTK